MQTQATAQPRRASPPPNQPLSTFEATIQRLVRQDGRDLSLRQLAVLLILGRRPIEECTVRGIALMLDVSKPAVCRAFDRLCENGLMHRREDRFDRRSVQGELTPAGRAYVDGVAA